MKDRVELCQMVSLPNQSEQLSDSLTFVDLFCGCGGFTLGMLRAGFDCLAAIDFNEQAVATLKANLADKEHASLMSVRHALQRDLTSFKPAELAAIIGTDRLDVIVGGPPCQGFSTARQRDGSNHGNKRLKEDPRRHLFRNFLDFVEFFQPKVFVIENVIRSVPYSQIARRAQEEPAKLAELNPCERSGEVRMHLVLCISGALKLFGNFGTKATQALGVEIPPLGQKGFDLNDTTARHEMRSLPGKFSGLHLLPNLYAGLQQFTPGKHAANKFTHESEMENQKKGTTRRQLCNMRSR